MIPLSGDCRLGCTTTMANDTNSLKDVESVINLFRQVIAQAQWDYANGRTTFIYAGGAATVTARRFLFRDDGLEMLVERWGLPFDVEAERNKAIELLEQQEAIRSKKRIVYRRFFMRKVRGYKGRRYTRKQVPTVYNV